ncbi:MFS transporter [Fuerstiella marisgermanici]|uniref:Oxalate/formate antiporter n=1 Tax=Fuerstiella marisgermanici TaxID=1891926 RepID=A0A1P8WDL2_9PLAN|nr:MFS transporter [Fuerstiella marisgermanici]APZ92121.1 oxalate/formate antiporter [Fuerstiella marisgermanici]
MLAIAAATVFMSAPGQSFSVAAFVDPMLEELGIDRTGYSIAYMTATLIGGALLPFIGRLVDRFGARKILPLVAVGLGGACTWMGQVGSLAGLYVGFTMIRCLGQGSLTLIANWIVGEWFHDYRGRAAGICAVGGTASVLIVPQVNNLLIDYCGWRNTWIVLGGIVCGLLVVPAAVFLRDRPEPLGFLPDWRFPVNETTKPEAADTPMQTVEASHADAVPFISEKSYTVKEAIRCSAFWKIASVVATVSLVGTGLMFHQVSILNEKGVSRALALSALGVQAVAATVSTLIAGYLIDHMPARFVLASSMALEVCAILLLIFLPSPGWIFLYSALLGLHGGIIRSAGSMVWINYFGRQHQGAIQGVSMSIMVFAAAIGPVPAAIADDVYGTYGPALWAFLALPIIAGVAILSATPVSIDHSTEQT